MKINSIALLSDIIHALKNYNSDSLTMSDKKVIYLHSLHKSILERLQADNPEMNTGQFERILNELAYEHYS